mmetsp:Transcript_13967/g.52374  ORF Transcript_13967/g.52374 Transcript_13967/m.52374 type:complete len:305 (-) Transcript_13967:1224-2138(-)
MMSSASRNTKTGPVLCETALFLAWPIPPGFIVRDSLPSVVSVEGTSKGFAPAEIPRDVFSPLEATPTRKPPHRLPDILTSIPTFESTSAQAFRTTGVSSPDASSYALTCIAPQYVCANTEAKHSSSHGAASCAGTIMETTGRLGSGFCKRFACVQAFAARDAAPSASSKERPEDSVSGVFSLSLAFLSGESPTRARFGSFSAGCEAPSSVSDFSLTSLPSQNGSGSSFGKPNKTLTPPCFSKASCFTQTIPFAISRGVAKTFVVPQCTSHGCKSATDPERPVIWEMTPKRLFLFFSESFESFFE